MAAGGTAGTMTDGMVRVGTGAAIVCVKAWDGAVNAVGIDGNVASAARSGATVARTAVRIVANGVINR